MQYIAYFPAYSACASAVATKVYCTLLPRFSVCLARTSLHTLDAEQYPFHVGHVSCTNISIINAGLESVSYQEAVTLCNSWPINRLSSRASCDYLPCCLPQPNYIYDHHNVYDVSCRYTKMNVTFRLVSPTTQNGRASVPFWTMNCSTMCSHANGILNCVYRLFLDNCRSCPIAFIPLTTWVALHSVVPCFAHIVTYCEILRSGLIRPILCVPNYPTARRRARHVRHHYVPAPDLRHDFGPFVTCWTHTTAFIYCTPAIFLLRLCAATVLALAIGLRPATTLPSAFVLAVYFSGRHFWFVVQTCRAGEDGVRRQLILELHIERVRLSHSRPLQYMCIHIVVSLRGQDSLASLHIVRFFTTGKPFPFACHLLLVHFIIITQKRFRSCPDRSLPSSFLSPYFRDVEL